MAISRGRMREIFRWEQAMFLYRFLALFEERKSWGAMPKLTFSFSHTDPRKTHFFEKIRKDESRLVRKSLFENRKIEISKSVFGCLGWVRKSKSVKKWVKNVDFFSRAPFEKWLEGKNSPDFCLATASIFEPFRFNLGAESTFKFFEIFRKQKVP